MKTYFLAISLILTGLVCSAQNYNNEWIDYSKAYYKFNVGATGLYQISKTSLSNAGLGSVPAQNFQLWHNGLEVPLYISMPVGVLGASDYIEFYGEINDGKEDTKLYKYDSLQMSDKNSLYTDTAAYFLTINTASSNKRFTDDVNDVAGNVLSPEPYFMHKLAKYYKNQMNVGYGIDLGELVSAASYETAEGWSSSNLLAGGKLSDNNALLRLYPSGPTASLTSVMAGNAYTSRSIVTKLRGVTLGTTAINGYNISRTTINSIPLAYFANDSARLEFSNTSTSTADKMVVSHFELTYPRQFNFNGASQFYFELQSSLGGKYLEITNFNVGTGVPVLLDLTNNLRYTGVLAAGIIKFALPPSGSRKFALVTTDASKIIQINSFNQRNFIDYSNASNQGEYIIISHPQLYNDGAGNNNVEKYRAYRSSAAGGNYNAKTIDIDQLVDQFGFGIKHHPIAIRNFSTFALANFTQQPKYFFLIGKGLNYVRFKSNESSPWTTKLAMIPTFGFPSSDNLLTASRTGEYSLIPIGRLSAITGKEIGIYLDKIKQYELVQKTAPQTIGDKAWMKNVAEVTGGLNDASLAGLITSYMQGYEEIATDTLFGAKVYQFSANSGTNKALNSTKTIENLFSEGLSLITYFGHSSPNTIEFNLDDPSSYNNTGKYPLIVVNGCESGDLFEFDTARAFSSGTLSEKFVFADQKGSIGYIASTHFGLPTQLNYFNTEFYRNFSNKMYGETLGNILQQTMKNVVNTYVSDFAPPDYIARTHVEEITLHGDPAITLNAHLKADYATQDSMLNYAPLFISIAEDKVTITAKILNIGKATFDSIPVLVKHTLPDNSVVTIFNSKIKPINYEDSLTLELPIDPLKHKGLNQITVTIDPNNILDELSESNNIATKSFTIIENEIRPVYPYNYAIINDNTPTLTASTADPVAAAIDYVMEMDTTATFNSAFKITQTINAAGGIIQFSPGTTLTDSTVYYWRVAMGPVTSSTHWLSSSFIYINGADEGFNQSHYYQYKNDTYANIQLDSVVRRFGFDTKISKMLVRAGLYPFYNWDQNNVHIDDIQVDYWGCTANMIQFYVFDSSSLIPWDNVTQPGGRGRFGSSAVCNGPRSFFEFALDQQTYRGNAMKFMDSIPDGSFVMVRNLLVNNPSNIYINTWKADTTTFGSGNSLWHKFKENGLTEIDSFTRNVPFVFVYKKGDSVTIPIYQTVGSLPSTQIVNNYYLPGKQITGTVTSPWFGPVKAWKNFKWDELPNPTSTTQKTFDIISKNAFGEEVILTTILDSKDTTISFIDAATFPYLKIRMHNTDSSQAQPLQLKYWMLTGTPVPEGAIAPGIAYNFQDTMALGDTLHFKVGFKNISNSSFDSIKVRLTITDRNGGIHVYNNQSGGFKIEPLAGGDSAIVKFDISADYFGENRFFLDINPGNDQPEQFHFNNVLYKSWFITLPAVCNDQNVTVYSGRYAPGNTYQWQVNTGSGYVNISDNSLYSGVNKDTLTIKRAPNSMYGYKYRALINKNSVLSTGYEFTLKFAMFWTGEIDDAWEKHGNWSCDKVPDENTDVIINPGLYNYPVIKSNAVCRSIIAKTGTSVQINSGYTLTITGSGIE
ncbi:MAG: C25 family cysteine peptidase [Bacteroidota bacterium]